MTNENRRANSAAELARAGESLRAARLLTDAGLLADAESRVSYQPVVQVWLHSPGNASSRAALLLHQIQPVFSVVAPCRRGASPASVRRQTCTTGW